MVERVLFVCEGNTCRSPMAEAIAKTMLPLDTVLESAGLETTEGMHATAKAITAMAEIGLDIDPHRSRRVDQVNLVGYDIVVALTPSIAKKLCSYGVPPEHLVSISIDDPYGKDLAHYRVTRDRIREALTDLFHSLITSRGI